MSLEVHNVDSYDQFKELVQKVSLKWSSKQLVLLTGPLGIGKSEWVRLSLKSMGYNQNIPSPTFILHQEYSWNGHTVDHVDLYRIKKEQELESFGFFDLFLKEKGIIFIEWADKINFDHWPKDWNCIHLDFKWRDSKRTISIKSLS